MLFHKVVGALPMESMKAREHIKVFSFIEDTSKAYITKLPMIDCNMLIHQFLLLITQNLRISWQVLDLALITFDFLYDWVHIVN